MLMMQVPITFGNKKVSLKQVSFSYCFYMKGQTVFSPVDLAFCVFSRCTNYTYNIVTHVQGYFTPISKGQVEL